MSAIAIILKGMDSRETTSDAGALASQEDLRNETGQYVLPIEPGTLRKGDYYDELLQRWMFYRPDDNWPHLGIDALEASRARGLLLDLRSPAPDAALPLRSLQLASLLAADCIAQEPVLIPSREGAVEETSVGMLAQYLDSRPVDENVRNAQILGLLAAISEFQYPHPAETNYPVYEVTHKAGLFRALGYALQVEWTPTSEAIEAAEDYQQHFVAKCIFTHQPNGLRTGYSTATANPTTAHYLEDLISTNRIPWSDETFSNFHQLLIEICEGLTDFVHNVPPYDSHIAIYRHDEVLAPVFDRFTAIRREILAYREMIMAQEEPLWRKFCEHRLETAKYMHTSNLYRSEEVSGLLLRRFQPDEFLPSPEGSDEAGPAV